MRLNSPKLQNLGRWSQPHRLYYSVNAVQTGLRNEGRCDPNTVWKLCREVSPLSNLQNSFASAKSTSLTRRKLGRWSSAHGTHKMAGCKASLFWCSVSYFALPTWSGVCHLDLMLVEEGCVCGHMTADKDGCTGHRKGPHAGHASCLYVTRTLSSLQAWSYESPTWHVHMP